VKKTIFLATISIDKMAGGIERQIIFLANHLSKLYSVHLITLDLPSAKSFYHISERVKWYKVGNSTPHNKISFYARIKQIFAIRKIFRKAEYFNLICFHHGLLFRFFIASLGFKKFFICSERNSLQLYSIVKQTKFSVNFLLLYFVDKITVQFRSYVHQYPFLIRKKIVVISNCLLPSQKIATPDLSHKNGRYKILTIGRLCAQKNQQAQITAFHTLSKKFPLWDLYIYGEGPFKQKLIKLIDELDLRNRVFVLSPVKNVSNLYSTANIFCITSLWEGFPNVLAEAMGHGLPCIGFSDCDGVNNLIKSKKSGFLTTPNELDKAMQKLMESKFLRKKFGAQSLSLSKAFEPSKMLKLWESTLNFDL